MPARLALSNGRPSTTTTPSARSWRCPASSPTARGAAPASEERWVVTAAGAEAAARGEPRRAPAQRPCSSCSRKQPEANVAFLDAHARPWREAARALAARGFMASTEVAERPHASARRDAHAGPCTPARAERCRRPPSAPRSARSPPSCCTGSPAAARPRSTCDSSSACSRRASARWCWCPRSASRRSSSAGSASASRPARGAALGAHRRASASRPGATPAAARRASCSARARRYSHRCPSSASSSSTRSTTPRSSSTRAGFATRRATWRWCAHSSRGVPVVLGSATPSLETLHNVAAQRYAAAAARTAGRARRSRRC